MHAKIKKQLYWMFIRVASPIPQDFSPKSKVYSLSSMSQVSRPMSHIPRLTSHVPRPTFHIPRPTFHIPCPLSHVPCLNSDAELPHYAQLKHHSPAKL